jgi:xanthine dehydrogenase accessory factor
MAKRNTGTRIDMAPVVIALGPGFDAGSEVHAVVETNRGPHLGRVIWRGSAEPDTGDPAPVSGRGLSRVLRAPAAGRLHAARSIGDIVEEGDVLATVDGKPLRADFRGLIRGMARDGLMVETGMKIGDLDPRIDPSLCRVVSDKALAVAGGVLEAILVLVAERCP